MPLQKNSTIEVRQVANGFIVMPSHVEERHRIVGDDERMVFPSLAALTEWLSQHFDHRTHAVPMDAAG